MKREEMVELVRQGRKEELWNAFCGFLDLSVDEFMYIQERLLREQWELVSGTPLGKQFLGGAPPSSIDEYREKVPLTEYEIYRPFLEDRREDILPEPPKTWAHTSGRSGRFKWVPYTERAFQSVIERSITMIILGMARGRGDVRLRENDVLVYNVPPPPYFSGISLLGVAELFPFRFVPSVEETFALDFQGRIERAFREALVTGIDVLGSISVVLVKIGEGFAARGRDMQFSRELLHPKAIWRLARGWLRSRMEGRSMLPRDLWSPKAILVGGTDTEIFRDRIIELWGVSPHEAYGATELGAAAFQTWTRRWLTFNPYAAFFEFIPLEEQIRLREQPTYRPRTVLMDEVQEGEIYEVVISNFYGMPFFRYRMRDLLKVMAMEDTEAGIRLPQFMVVGRESDLIDLAGFSGPIDERMVWRALISAGIVLGEWMARKEIDAAGKPIIHVYVEPLEPPELSVEELRQRIHERLKEVNPFYADIEEMLGEKPVELTLLNRGTFRAYYERKQEEGADLAHLKPPHMNPSDAIVEEVLRLSALQSP